MADLMNHASNDQDKSRKVIVKEADGDQYINTANGRSSREKDDLLENFSDQVLKGNRSGQMSGKPAQNCIDSNGSDHGSSCLKQKKESNTGRSTCDLKSVCRDLVDKGQLDVVSNGVDQSEGIRNYLSQSDGASNSLNHCVRISNDRSQNTSASNDVSNESANPSHDGEMAPDISRHGYCYSLYNTDGSPLVNSCAISSNPSPQVILGDLSVMQGKELVNIFSQGCTVNGPVRSPEQNTFSSQEQEQEVPREEIRNGRSSRFVSLESSAENSYSSWTTVLPANGQRDTSVVAAETEEDNWLDSSNRLYICQDDTDASQCHVVPDVGITPDVSKDDELEHEAVARVGVIFKERQFSPMLTVLASPASSCETSPTEGNTCECPPMSLSLHTSDCFADGVLPAASSVHQAESAALSPTDVRLVVVKESPRKAKLKRLGLTRTPGSERRCVSSVFDRLYGLRKPPGTAPSERNQPKNKSPNFTPVRHCHSAHKALCSPRLNMASQLRITAGKKATSRKALNFGCASDSSGKKPSRVVRTGHLNTNGAYQPATQEISKVRHHTTAQLDHTTTRTAMPQQCCSTVCNSTSEERSKISHGSTPHRPVKASHGTKSQQQHKTTSDTTAGQEKHKTSHVTAPNEDHRTQHGASRQKYQTAVIGANSREDPVHRQRCSSQQNVASKQSCAPKNTPNKAGCNLTPKSQAFTVYRKGTPRYVSTPKYIRTGQVPPKLNLDETDIDTSDLSSLDESIILQEKKVELERICAEKLHLEKKLLKQARLGDHNRRTALRPTTAENVPITKFRNTSTLKLSEPELDAITLVHTLCNSQQAVKRVTKAHATAVIRHFCAPKEASKVHWHEKLVIDVEDLQKPACETSRKPILHVRSPEFVYPFNDELPPSVVVMKSTKKCQTTIKEASPLISASSSGIEN